MAAMELTDLKFNHHKGMSKFRSQKGVTEEHSLVSRPSANGPCLKPVCTRRYWRKCSDEAWKTFPSSDGVGSLRICSSIIFSKCAEDGLSSLAL